MYTSVLLLLIDCSLFRLPSSKTVSSLRQTKRRRMTIFMNSSSMKSCQGESSVSTPYFFIYFSCLPPSTDYLHGSALFCVFLRLRQTYFPSFHAMVSHISCDGILYMVHDNFIPVCTRTVKVQKVANYLRIRPIMDPTWTFLCPLKKNWLSNMK